MTIVQEPPDVPKWVDVLEASYRRLVDSIQRANVEYHAAYQTARSACPAIYGLNGNFDKGVHHKNAIMYTAALYAKVGEELSIKGVKAEIPAGDLPEEFLPANERDFTDPYSFSPIKLYQYLFEKYAGKNARTLVQGDVSKAFTEHFGHGRWAFEDRSNEAIRLPKLDRFINESFKQEKNFYLGHITTTVDENSLSPFANMINWKFDSRSHLVKAIRNLADLLQLVDRDSKVIELVNKVANIVNEDVRGQTVPYAYKLGGRELGFTFRKNRLEVRFSVELLDIIRTFLLTHHPDFKRKS